MNPEDMTPEQLNEAVAKAKGWTRCADYRYWKTSKGKITVMSDWSTSMDSAMELVEEVGKTNETYFERKVGEKWWIMFGDIDNPFIGESDTLPKAICIAYLNWREKHAT